MKSYVKLFVGSRSRLWLPINTLHRLTPLQNTGSCETPFIFFYRKKGPSFLFIFLLFFLILGHVCVFLFDSLGVVVFKTFLTVEGTGGVFRVWGLFDTTTTTFSNSTITLDWREKDILRFGFFTFAFFKDAKTHLFQGVLLTLFWSLLTFKVGCQSSKGFGQTKPVGNGKEREKKVFTLYPTNDHKQDTRDDWEGRHIWIETVRSSNRREREVDRVFLCFQDNSPGKFWTFIDMVRQTNFRTSNKYDRNVPDRKENSEHRFVLLPFQLGSDLNW